MTSERFTTSEKYIMQDGEVWVVAQNDLNADVIATAMNEQLEIIKEMTYDIKKLYDAYCGLAYEWRDYCNEIDPIFNKYILKQDNAFNLKSELSKENAYLPAENLLLKTYKENVEKIIRNLYSTEKTEFGQKIIKNIASLLEIEL